MIRLALRIMSRLRFALRCSFGLRLRSRVSATGRA